MKGRYFRRGVQLALAIALCVAIVYVVRMAFGYNGKCGGFLSSLAAARQCTFWDYMSGEVLVFPLLLGLAYWPVLLVLILLPAIGQWLNRRYGRDE